MQYTGVCKYNLCNIRYTHHITFLKSVNSETQLAKEFLVKTCVKIVHMHLELSVAKALCTVSLPIPSTL